jgi:hypothetical protein
MDRKMGFQAGRVSRTIAPTEPNPMPRTLSSPIEDLRRAIDCLPLRTRQAMLDGVRSNEIIVGAYADRAGGVCPMLAAHRHGGRTSFVSFARAWDRFAGAKRARRATERELGVLVAHLEASILAEQEMADLGRAIADHQLIARARRAREARLLGTGWLRARRDRSDAQRALQRVERERV